jgi:hypothetical protein
MDMGMVDAEKVRGLLMRWRSEYSNAYLRDVRKKIALWPTLTKYLPVICKDEKLMDLISNRK